MANDAVKGVRKAVSTNLKKQEFSNFVFVVGRGNLGATVEAAGTTWNFQFAVCAPLKLPNGCPNYNNVNDSACYVAPTTAGGMPLKNNAGVCMSYPATGPGLPPNTFGTNCMGQFATSGDAAFHTSVITTNAGGVSISYSKGDKTEENEVPYHSIINVLCDKKTVGNPSISVSWTPGTSPLAVFTLSHASGCPINAKKRLSGGSICLIILTVAIVVYLVGGCLYNRFLKGRSGTGMIPNHTFWSNLPGLLMDGARFVICRPPLEGAKDYERIDA